MQILYAAFLSLSIIGIPAVSAQGTGIAHITSADASPNTKCLNVKSVDKGIPVEINDCDQSSPTEKWLVAFPGGAETQIRIANSNFCMDTGTFRTSSSVMISPCDRNSATQRWRYTDTDQILPIHNPHLCLDLPGYDLTNGNQVRTHPCNRGKNQKWPRVPV